MKLRKRDNKGNFTTSPAGKCLEYGPDAPRRNPARKARINPNSPGIVDRIVKASMGQSPGGTERPEYADGTVYESMKAQYVQSVNDVNPVTPPKKKPKTVSHVDLCTPSSSSTCTEQSTSTPA